VSTSFGDTDNESKCLLRYILFLPIVIDGSLSDPAVMSIGLEIGGGVEFGCFRR
jgi:hypothetical protein